MRLFVAIDVLPPEGPRDPSPVHLTLRFLGEVPAERLDAISAAIEASVRDGRPYDLILEGVGAFPSPSRPRVVWVGARAGGPETSEIAARLSTMLAQAGFPPERERFVPHVTLFRVRSPALHRRALALLSGEEAAPPARTVRVEEVALKESTLTPRGALHRTLRTFPLGRTARDPDPGSGH